MAKTKQCRDCKAEIPKNAKKCMHCGTKQGMGLIGGIFAVFFIIFVVSWVASSVSNNGGGNSPAPEQTPAQKQAASAKSDASTMCMNAIRSRAKFPSSVDFSVLSTPPAQQITGGGWRIYWAFESKNGLGNMVPQMAKCDVINGKLTSFNVANR